MFDAIAGSDERRPRRVPRQLLALGLCAGMVLHAIGTSATTIIPLSLGETVRFAEAIAVVRVERTTTRWGDNSRQWMVTDCDVRVEDTVLESDTVRTGRAVTLSIWGGTIGEERQVIAGVPMLSVGRRYLVMVKAGHGGAGDTAPFVGLTEGLFSIHTDPATGADMVSEAEGQPLRPTALAAARQFEASAALVVSTGTAVSLSAFLGALRANLTALRSTPEPRWMSQRSRSEPMPKKRGLVSLATELAAPAMSEPKSRELTASGAPARPAPPVGVGKPVPHGGNVVGSVPYQSNTPTTAYGHADLPIRVNTFPGLTGDRVNEVLATWTYYDGRLFLPLPTPTGDFGWPNLRFDFAGWIDSDDMAYVYGRRWGANEIGLCIAKFIGPTLAEADVMLNSSASWSWNDGDILDTHTAFSNRHVLAHEFGHMWGANHNFYGLSVMNYNGPLWFVSVLPFMDDAEGLRIDYGDPGGTPRSDLGIYFYYASGFQLFLETTYPISLTALRTLQVSNFTLENAGTTRVSTPTVEWYLTRRRDWSSYTYLGTTSYTALSRAQHLDPATTVATFDVPAIVGGDYYLAAFIRDDDSPYTSEYPYSNNSAFSAHSIKVFPAPPTIAIQPSSPSIPRGTSATIVVAAGGSPPFRYQWYLGSSGDAAKPIPDATTNTLRTPVLTSAARYWVAVSNEAGRVDSNTSTVKVYSPFTDDQLITRMDVIKAVHIRELRARIDSIRSAWGGHPAYAWTDPLLGPGTTIKATHILEMRTALAVAYVTAGKPLPTYSIPSPAPGVMVMATAISELRAAVIASEQW